MYLNRAIGVLLTGTALAGLSGTAQAQTAAQQTTAGTTVSNTASVTYTVNGTAQTTNSTTASFVVDRKVGFTTVTDQTGFTQVDLGEQNAVTRFKVTNTTNGIQDFILDPDQTNISVGILPGADDFDVQNLRVFVDANGNGVYDVNVDTATFIDELAPDASATVFIVGNVPNTAGATLAFDSLHVTVAAGGAAGTQGAVLVPTDLNIGNADDTVDIVFADDDSDGTLYLGDTARNGQGRAYSGYQIGTTNVALTVDKSARIIADGVNIANFKAIPGATVEYCLRVSNGTLATPASDVVLTDAIPANTTYIPGTLSMGAPGVLGVACTLLGSNEDDDADDTTETDGLTANFDAANNRVRARIVTVPGSGAVAASFQVRIN